MAFGRPGCGAPARTKSGRIRTSLIGNPDIRFQANEGVQKSIENNIRYMADWGEKAAYHAQLEEQVKQRKEQEAVDKQNSREVKGQILTFFFIEKLRFIGSLGGWRGSSGGGQVQGEPTGGRQPSPGRDSSTRWWLAPSSFAPFVHLHLLLVCTFC